MFSIFTPSMTFPMAYSFALRARVVPSTHNLHFVLGMQLIGHGTGSFGRGLRKSALQKMLYLSDELLGTHLRREERRGEPETNLTYLSTANATSSSHTARGL